MYACSVCYKFWLLRIFSTTVNCLYQHVYIQIRNHCWVLPQTKNFSSIKNLHYFISLWVYWFVYPPFDELKQKLSWWCTLWWIVRELTALAVFVATFRKRSTSFASSRKSACLSVAQHLCFCTKWSCLGRPAGPSPLWQGTASKKDEQLFPFLPEPPTTLPDSVKVKHQRGNKVLIIAIFICTNAALCSG